MRKMLESLSLSEICGVKKKTKKSSTTKKSVQLRKQENFTKTIFNSTRLQAARLKIEVTKPRFTEEKNIFVYVWL